MEVDRQGSPGSRAALPMGILAAALLVGGGTAWLARGRIDALVICLLVIGGGNAILALALGGGQLVELLRSRRGRVGANVTLMSALAVALCVLVNAISTRNYALHDLTESGRFTISEQTESILRELGDSGKSVRVTVLYRSNPFLGPFLDRASDLLDAYATRTSAIDVERIDIEFEPDRAELFVQRFRDVPPTATDGAVAFESEGNRRLLTMDELIAQGTSQADAFRFRGEEAFTGAILSVTESRRKRVLFVTGHDEAELDTNSEVDANIWASELRRLNVEVDTLELPTAKRIPDGTGLLVIVRPHLEAPFAQRELRLLERYIDRGGNLMVLVEPLTPPQLELGLTPDLPRWLAKYGAEMPEGEILIDPPGSIATTPIVFLTSEFGDHPISRELGALMLPIHLARPVLPRLDNPKGFDVTALVSSSADGWSETDCEGDRLENPELDPERDRRGPVPLALALESSATGARIVVVGDANTALDLGMTAFPNRTFVMNATNWLLRREPLVSLPSRPLDDRRLLELSRAQVATIFWVSVVGMPLFVLVSGLFVALRRRR